nr:hypothetical protein [Methylomarinum sp. Ch1-1]MDP4523219.1 hypothetical protein [Methylomarinum sp. Ch1-1]
MSKKDFERPRAKIKKVNRQDMDQIINELGNMHRKSEYDSVVITWLSAGLLVGLRPIEWKDARLDGTRLIIRNAKATNSRACGEYRVLDLKHFDQINFSMIQEMLSIIENVNNFDSFYKICSNHLYRINKAIWSGKKRRITLYSPRHQFAANAKSSGLSKVEIAALMGHASDQTAGFHYGRKASGDRLIVIPANEDNMKHVRQIASHEISFSNDKRSANDSNSV